MTRYTAMLRNRVPLLLGLLPLWTLGFLVLEIPGFLDPVFDSTLTLAGLPAGIAILIIDLLVMVAGVEVLRRTTSPRSAVLAFLLLTFPAVMIVILTPATIFVVRSL